MPTKVAEARARLRRALAGLPAGSAACVCFSGGLDSTVLLHLAAAVAPRKLRLYALHVNHGLQPQANAWAKRCGDVAAAWQVPFEVARAKVAARPAASLENRARQARLRIWRQQDGAALLMAHHADDQAETVLLRALRGSGPRGLAAMRFRTRVPGGEQQLLRPLLACRRAELQDYAQEQGLDGIVDPANADLRHNRNWLRHELLPVLEERFPGARQALRQCAAAAAEGSELLDQLADEDDRLCRGTDQRYSRAALRRLGSPRLKNWLRRRIAAAGLQPPPAGHLEEAARQLRAASEGFAQRFGTLELRGTQRYVSWRPAPARAIGRIASASGPQQSK